MNNTNINYTDNESNLDFLNERVVKHRKSDIIRLFFIIIVCTVLVGAVVCIVFVWIKPYNKPVFSERKLAEGSISYTISDDSYEVEDTTSFYLDNDNIITSPIEVNKLIDSVVCISSNPDSERLTSDNSFITSGLVIDIDDKYIYILTYYDKIINKDEVLIYFNEDNGYVGKVKNYSKDYKLALIETEVSNISPTDMKRISKAIISPRRDFSVGENITYISNPLDKKAMVTKGSLTSNGNTVSIMDAQMQIISTDIIQSGERNGFIFDEKGYIIGIVINDSEEPSDNIISFIDMNNLIFYVEKMIQNEQIAFIGIYGKEVTTDVIKNIDPDMPYGIYISGIKDESPAYNAGILGGDILVSVNNKDIHNFNDYNEVIYNCNQGEEISVVVMRKGKEGYKKIEYKVMVDGL